MSIESLIGEPAEDVLSISAKTGEGVQELLETIIQRVPPPDGQPDSPLQALIFDSLFNQYRGAIAYVRIFEGTLRRREAIRFMATKCEYLAEEIGVLRLGMQPTEELSAGDVGYVIG